MKIKCTSCGKEFKLVDSQAYCEKCDNILIGCETCGLPLTKTNKYGMFCKNECGLKKSKQSSKELEDLIKMFIPKGCK